MKLDNPTVFSYVRSAAAALALSFSICWTGQVVSHPVHISSPSKDPKTHHAVIELSQHAQRKESEEDTNVRLMPKANTNQSHMEICCLHANILNFYLNNISHKYKEEHPRMHQSKTDSHRVSEDSQSHGCNLTHYHDHHQAVEFRKKSEKMEGERGINKAVGEIDILFTYSHDYCEPSNNNTNAGEN